MKKIMYGFIILSLMTSGALCIANNMFLMKMGLLIVAVIQAILFTILIMGLYELSDNMDKVSKVILDLGVKSVEFAEIQEEAIKKEEV